MGGMREQCGTLKNHWYVAAKSGQVQRKASWPSVILETRLVLFRQQDGQVAALRDRCSHRHMPLSFGKVEGDAVRCMYHGWSYDRTGECVNVPSEGPCGKAFAGRAVESFPVIEAQGLIWVWMGGPANPPDKQPFEMPSMDNDGWRGFYMENMFEANVTNCVENFIDVPHTVWVHPGWFRDRKGIKVPVSVERTDQSVALTYHTQEDSFGWGNWLFNPKKLPMVHTDRFIMPNNTRVDYIWGEQERGFVIISTSVPVTPELTRVYTLVNLKCGVLTPLLTWAMRWYAQKIIAQDYNMMAKQSRSLADGDIHFRHTPADTPHLFVESLRHWAEQGEVGKAPKPAVKEIEIWL